MYTRYLADVRAGSSEACVKAGSGYRIAPSLVLTAGHNLVDLSWHLLPRLEIRLGHPSETQHGPFRAVRVWTSRTSDVAVLRIVESVEGSSRPQFDPLLVRWGNVHGTDRLRYVGLGFPAFADYETGGRGVEQLSGALNPLSVGPSGTIPIDQDAFPSPNGQRNDRGWEGVSGAAIFARVFRGSLESPMPLIGVVVLDDRAFGNRRLHAVPAHHFAMDEELATLIADDKGCRPKLEGVWSAVAHIQSQSSNESAARNRPATGLKPRTGHISAIAAVQYVEEQILGSATSSAPDQAILGACRDIESELCRIAKHSSDSDLDRRTIHRARSLLANSSNVIPEAPVLRLALARACNNIGEYEIGLRESELLIDSYPQPRAAYLHTAALSLLNLCQFREASQIFAAIPSSTYTANSGPSIIEEHEARIKFSADLFRLLWIPHYCGDLRTPAKHASRILGLAREFGNQETYDVLHRVARVQFDIGRLKGKRRQMIRSLETLARARRVGGSAVNVFSPLAQFYVTRQLGQSEWQLHLDEANEMATDLGDTGIAHSNLAKARCELSAGAVLTGIELAQEALDVWSRHRYPRGVVDALGTIASGEYLVGTKPYILRAFANVNLACLISSALGLRIEDELGRLQTACVAKASVWPRADMESLLHQAPPPLAALARRPTVAIQSRRLRLLCPSAERTPFQDLSR